MAYRLALPVELERYHNVFHISQFRKYMGDASHVLDPEEVELGNDLSYEECPVQILDQSTRKTRNREVKLVKVLWSRHRVEEVTGMSKHSILFP